MDSPFHTPRHAPRAREDSIESEKATAAIDLLPGRSRVAFAVTLPLMMIATTVHIQKLSSDASMRPSGGDGETVEEIHEANYALLNRTCAGGLVPQHRSLRGGGAALAPGEPAYTGAKVIIGAGFVASGVTTIASVLQSAVPGACQPPRGGIGKESYWTTLATTGTGTPRRKKKGVGRQLNSTRRLAQLPSVPYVRQTYLRGLGWSQTGSCQVAWEASDRVASLSRDGRNLCVPFIIRHYFPAARVVLVLADPVERAVLQQSNWLYNRCWASAHDALRAHDDGAKAAKAKRAKNAARGCERFGAQLQLQAELECLRTCELHATPTLEKAMSCASTCSKALHNSFPAECGVGGSCPYLTLLHSHYSLVLPLWLQALPCDQLLILQRGQLFEEREVHAAPPPPPVFSPFARAATPPPISEGRRKVGELTLRFLGATAANGSLDLLQSLPAQSALSAALNPIDARLRRELDEYFEPFEAALEHQLSAHHRCFTERSRLKRSRPKTVGR